MILPVLLFSVLTAFWLLVLGGASEALGLPIEIGLAQLAPGIAGLLMLVIFRKDGLVSLSVAPGELLPLLVAGFAANLIPSMIFALSEEWDWRGYLEPRLNQTNNTKVSRRRHRVIGILAVH